MKIPRPSHVLGLVHLTCQSAASAYEDLSPVVTKMFHTSESEEKGSTTHTHTHLPHPQQPLEWMSLQPVSIFCAGDRPSALWCFYFNMADGSALQDQVHDLPSNVFMCSGPDGGLSHEYAIKQVTHIHSTQAGNGSSSFWIDTAVS